MSVLRQFLGNHVLANLTFALVLILGAMSYSNMPRARDPDINFNWISIATVLPGVSSLEVEKRVTNPIEDAISSSVKDLKFVSSTSRSGVSLILVRFNELSSREFDQHMADLRREVQNVYTDQLPSEASDPKVIEISTSSGFPTAVIALSTTSYDEDFRRYSANLKKEFERLAGVDAAKLEGVEDPELLIEFYPERLVGLGISPAELADTVGAYFSDTSIGDLDTSSGKWIVRLEGTGGSIEDLEAFPVVGTRGVVALGSLADIYRAAAEPSILVNFQGDAAVMVSITKQDDVNILDILADLRAFIALENEVIGSKGYHLSLIDDQTVSTREAISLMQTNALIGLILVVLVTYIFLGAQIALLTSIGIPFTLAGTFILLDLMGYAVSNPVLIGVVIALGMLVDDAVVVVEAIYYRLQRGASAMNAAIASLQEVAAPVFTSVLTTIAVFLPLMLMPGMLGKFMRVIPLVVCSGLVISLLEAFWMLPAHVAVLNTDFSKEGKLQRKRRIFTRKIRRYYSLILIKAFRRPRTSLLIAFVVVASAFGLLASDAIKKDFFASDPYRIFYVGAELPMGSSLQQSLAVALSLEQALLKLLKPNELRASIAYSGQMLTDIAPLYGDNRSQVLISINPDDGDMRAIRDIVAAVEAKIGDQFNGARISTVLLEDGPPVGQPINLKIRGQDFEQIQAVVTRIVGFMNKDGTFKNISTDFSAGNPEMALSLKGDAIKRAGLSPVTVTRSLRSYVDGEIVNQYQYLGEEADVRVRAKHNRADVDTLLQQTIASPSGQVVAFGELVDVEYGHGYQSIRHYNFQRAISIRADFDGTQTNTVDANARLQRYWQSIRQDHLGLSIDYSGELDDIQESLDGLGVLFIMGLGLIYLILGTQFKSYSQPLLVLVSVPLAFSGVAFGLLFSGNPLSLMTMYGVIALSGMSVNAAIVLISAANERLSAGMSVLHATVFAARRRVIPILITSFTTVAGLFSLAAGFAGESLVWGPVATAIISGLAFSTILILIVIPLLFLAATSLRIKLENR